MLREIGLSDLKKSKINKNDCIISLVNYTINL